MTADPIESLFAPLLDSAYRTALCLADGTTEAEALLQEAVTHGFERIGRPGTDGDLRCRVLRSMTEIFRRRHRRGGTGQAGAAYGTGSPSEGDRIVTAIRALRPSSRVVAALCFCEGLTCSEIADLLRCSRSAVRRRVSAVRTAFRGLGAAGRGSDAREAGELSAYRSVPRAGPVVRGQSAFRGTT
jgi:DNA-directed RNA polymerase specialized sigma24 family protein